MAEGTGALLVDDLAELTDTLELLADRPPRHARPGGIATVHDSGAERTLVADLAESLGVPFAPLTAPTRARSCTPRSMTVSSRRIPWICGATAPTPGPLFGTCLAAMAADPAVAVTALAVDLVEEYDGDTSYPDALLDVAKQTDAPLVVLSNLASALDAAAAAELRGGRHPRPRRDAQRARRARASAHAGVAATHRRGRRR